MGSVAHQQALVQAHACHVTAELLSKVNACIWTKVEADRKHGDLLLCAMRCGFDPANQHKHVSLTEWAGRRVRLVQAMLPKHVQEGMVG